MQALGMIETRGLVATIVAADAMLKTAQVTLRTREIVGGGLVTVLVEGDIASVKAAVDAGAVAAQSVGEIVAAHVIGRPLDEVGDMLPYSAPTEILVTTAPNLETMRVSDLRSIARKLGGCGMTAKQIRYAKKEELLENIQQIQE